MNTLAVINAIGCPMPCCPQDVVCDRDWSRDDGHSSGCGTTRREMSVKVIQG